MGGKGGLLTVFQPTDTDDIGSTLPATTTLDTELLSPLSQNLQVRKTKPNNDIFTVRAELDQWERRNISVAEHQPQPPQLDRII